MASKSIDSSGQYSADKYWRVLTWTNSNQQFPNRLATLDAGTLCKTAHVWLAVSLNNQFGLFNTESAQAFFWLRKTPRRRRNNTRTQTRYWSITLAPIEAESSGQQRAWLHEESRSSSDPAPLDACVWMYHHTVIKLLVPREAIGW